MIVLEWLVVVAAFTASVYAIVAAIWFTAAPGETRKDHPKHLVLKEDR